MNLLQPTIEHDLRRVADLAADGLSQSAEVLAVCLIGSVARGDARSDSDIDLLVVGEREIRRSVLNQSLPRAARDERLSFMTYSRERWAAEAAAGSLFVHHVRLEGIPLLDRRQTLARALANAATRPPDVDGEIKHQLRRLRLYGEPERLNGQHLFALAHLYAIGKAIAIARCVGLDETTFVKADALARLAERRPDLAEGVAAIIELEPFYHLARDRPRLPLPFEPVNVDRKLIQARTAIERIARG